MDIERMPIDGVLILRPVKHRDHRGYLAETFKASELKKAGVGHDWVQENHSLSLRAGVVRGLHFQAAPVAQAKLVRVLRGAIYDVVLDIRSQSPTFGRHVGIELSAENFAQVYVPIGCAHGFCTRADDTEVLYKLSSEHSPPHEGGLLWNDPDLNIAWPAREAIISSRDAQWPRFKDFASPF